MYCGEGEDMFRPGPEWIIVILMILLFVFGAKRLPEVGSSLGKGIRTFKSAVTGEDEKLE
jgi:sec-independent protein translocase protein TatA